MELNTSQPPTQAPAAPKPQPQRAGAASYHTSDVAQLATWLESHGWQRADPKSNPELGRYWLGCRLIVLFLNGTALIQGLEPQKTHALLAELAGGGE